MINIYTDGGARGNPGPSAIGVVICNTHQDVLCEHKEFLGENTNNVAEYTALIRALEIAQEFSKGEVHCLSDSELMVKQLNGEYQIKAAHLKLLHEQVMELTGRFEKVTFNHHTRDHDKLVHADRLVNEALDSQAS